MLLDCTLARLSGRVSDDVMGPMEQRAVLRTIADSSGRDTGTEGDPEQIVMVHIVGSGANTRGDITVNMCR